MLSSLEALEKAEAGASGTRSTIFQPKVKPRIRKTSGCVPVSDVKRCIDIAAGAKDTGSHFDVPPDASVNDTQNDAVSCQSVATKYGEKNALLHEQDVNEDALPNASTIAGTLESHRSHGKDTKRRESLDILSTYSFTNAGGCPSDASRSSIQLSILKSTTGTQGAELDASTTEILPTLPLQFNEADLLNEFQTEKVHYEQGGIFSQTASSIDQSTRHMVNGNDGSDHAGKTKQKKKVKKTKLPHRTTQRKRRVEKTVDTAADPTHLTMKQIITWAEAKERKKIKETASKEKDPVASTLSSQPKADNRVRAEKTTGMAPQVQIIDGKIVINEQSLTISANAASKDDLGTYRRVDENLSKLNYQSYMNKPRTERWTDDETSLFYKAVQQFGTDFALIQTLFPGRTRRQVKAKFKKEDRLYPFRMNSLLRHRAKDYAHYEEVIDKLKASEKSDQADFFDYQLDAYAGLPASTQDGATMTNGAAMLDPKESENSEALREEKDNVDSAKPKNVSSIATNEEVLPHSKTSAIANADRKPKPKLQDLHIESANDTEPIEEIHKLVSDSSYQDTEFDNPLGLYG